MLTITEYTVEQIKDPFNILSGDRYEFLLYLDVPEDDELHTDKGLALKVLYTVDGDKQLISNYNFVETETNEYLDFELEDDEKEMIEAFCRNNLNETEEE
ncbi:DUF6509 family protein [Metabacillus iocasae]|uniref:Pullulanase n=1 Tax=Priestia iocasae TaxID=2291674 RepID=A0ABS2QWF1_9BACI|nr:DUF6509 family protein [Metabacillus iocasae]MBM7703287.1 hypothetical protein [Metabacillus iocasae]